jgi:hypothetical protein
MDALSPSWVTRLGLIVALAFVGWGLYVRDSGWAIVGATVFLAAMTTILALHTERLAKATERSEALEGRRHRRNQLDLAIQAAMNVRSADANGVVQRMAAGYVPPEADWIHVLAMNAELIEDKDTRLLVEKWSNLWHTYPGSEIIAIAGVGVKAQELQKEYQTMKDRLQAEVLRWEKALKAE